MNKRNRKERLKEYLKEKKETAEEEKVQNTGWRGVNKKKFIKEEANREDKKEVRNKIVLKKIDKEKDPSTE